MNTALQISSLLVAPVFGLLGVYIGGRLQAKKDEERWARELHREGTRWSREDRQRWLDEQYRLYSDLMATMSEALQATKSAYELHPSYSWGRQDPHEAVRRVAVAREAVKATKLTLDAIALLGDPKIQSTARDLQGDLSMIAWNAEREDVAGVLQRLSDARRGFGWLRELIREQLGVETDFPADEDGEEQESDDTPK